MSARTLVRAATALTIGGALVVGGSIAAAPAMADDRDFTTDRQLFDIDDQTAVLDGNTSIVREDRSFGWTDDAFDYAGELTVRVCDEDFQFGTEYDLSGASADSGVTSQVVDTPGGTSSYVIDWSVSTECGDTDVRAVITLQGSYLSWAYSFSGTPAESATWHGDVYTDDDTEWLYPSASSAVAFSNEASEKDSNPLAMKFGSVGDTDAVSVEDDDNISYTVTDPSSLAVIVAFADASFDTGYDEAVDYLAAAAPTLDETFGESLPVFFGTDAPAYDEQQLVSGTEAEGNVSYTYAPLDVSLGDEVPEDYFADGPTVYSIGGEVPGLDLIVSFDQATGLPVVTYSGTPTVAGTFTVPITFYKFESDGDETSRPLSSSVSFVVTNPGVPITPADGGDELAETGADSAPFVGGAAALFLLGAMTLLVARRRAAKA